VSNSSSESPGTASIPDNLANALRTAHVKHIASMATLREAVCDYADELRSKHASNEEIVTAIRALVSRLRAARLSNPDTEADTQLIERMVDWCREHWRRPRYMP
jgi:hypothetical protein